MKIHTSISSLMSVILSASLYQSANAAWIWDTTGLTETFDGSGEYLLASGTGGASASFSLTPLATDYDTTNALDGRGFDISPTAVTFEWSSDQDIEIRLVTNPGSNGVNNTSFEFILNGDGAGVAASEISFDTIYSQSITHRGEAGGGLGVSVNTVDTVLDINSALFDGNSAPINVTAGLLDFRSLFSSPGNPNNFNTDGSYSWDNFTSGSANIGAFAGLTNSDNTAAALPFNNINPSATIGRQNLTINVDDASTGTNFLLSFDGGVAAVAAVPEPSSSLVVALGLFSLLGIRKRK